MNYTYHIYYTISYHTIHYHFIFHDTIPYDTISYLMIQYNIIFYNIILYDSMQYHTFFLQCQHKSSARSYDDWRFSFSYSLFGHYLSPYCLWTFPWVSSITTRNTRPMWPVNRGCLLLQLGQYKLAIWDIVTCICTPKMPYINTFSISSIFYTDIY